VRFGERVGAGLQRVEAVSVFLARAVIGHEDQIECRWRALSPGCPIPAAAILAENQDSRRQLPRQ
jgi:hypothetical protein